MLNSPQFFCYHTSEAECRARWGKYITNNAITLFLFFQFLKYFAVMVFRLTAAVFPSGKSIQAISTVDGAFSATGFRMISL
jgi:hypothetical protein